MHVTSTGSIGPRMRIFIPTPMPEQQGSVRVGSGGGQINVYLYNGNERAKKQEA